MKNFFILISFIATSQANAQDVITLIKGGNIQAKVQEINSKV